MGRALHRPPLSKQSSFPDRRRPYLVFPPECSDFSDRRICFCQSKYCPIRSLRGCAAFACSRGGGRPGNPVPTHSLYNNLHNFFITPPLSGKQRNSNLLPLRFRSFPTLSPRMRVHADGRVGADAAACVFIFNRHP